MLRTVHGPTVPKAAIVYDQDQPAVFVVAGGVAHKRPVTLGPAQGDRLAVTGGLGVGVRVVVEGAAALDDGMAVSEAGAAPKPANSGSQRVTARLSRHTRSLVLAFLLLTAAGLASALKLPVSLFPRIDFPRVVVSVDAGDRAADQTVAQVTRPLEQALRGPRRSADPLHYCGQPTSH